MTPAYCFVAPKMLSFHEVIHDFGIGNKKLILCSFTGVKGAGLQKPG